MLLIKSKQSFMCLNVAKKLLSTTIMLPPSLGMAGIGGIGIPIGLNLGGTGPGGGPGAGIAQMRSSHVENFN